MRDVGRVVDAESDGDDEVVAGDGVDGQAPEVHEAADLHQAENNAELRKAHSGLMVINV